jgi:DNA-binding NtrC family response regulator
MKSEKESAKLQKHFKVIVLEDSEFYNKLLTRQLFIYTESITTNKGCTFDIQSYTNAVECFDNIQPDIDVAFIDYFLCGSVNAHDIISHIKSKCPFCRIIIISEKETVQTAIQTIIDGASDFIYKGRGALLRSCFIVDEVINLRLRRGMI